MTITGTISGFSWNQDANRDVDLPFQFQFIAKVVEPTTASGLSMPTTNLLNNVDFSHVAAFTGQSQINSLKGQVATLEQVLADPLSSTTDKAAALQALGTTTGGTYGTFLQNSNSALTGTQATIDSWTTAQQNFTSGVVNSSMFQSVESSLAGVRLNLFSPVYGVMSSLTKLVKNTFGTATGLIASVINPVRNILRDITNISNQAIALVNLVNTSVSGLGRYISGTLSGLSTDFQTAISTLGKAAGAIATAPLTVSQSIQAMFTNSALTTNTPFLTYSSKLSFTRPTLSIGSAPAPSKVALLAGIKPYSSSNPQL
jgi:phage-related protein